MSFWPSKRSNDSKRKMQKEGHESKHNLSSKNTSVKNKRSSSPLKERWQNFDQYRPSENTSKRKGHTTHLHLEKEIAENFRDVSPFRFEKHGK